MSRPFQRGLWVSACCLVLLAYPVRAQETEPPRRSEEVEAGRTARDEQNRYDRLVERFKTPYFALDLLLQGVGTFAFEESDRTPSAFAVGTARIKVHGTLHRGFGYLLQTDFASSPALLDARVSYAPSETFRVQAGRYRVPFSYERLTSSASTDFISRSRIVRALVPGRAVGAGLRATAVTEALELRMGVFNAVYERTRTGLDAEGEREPGEFLVAGRLAYRSERARQNRTDGWRLTVGTNAGYEATGTSPRGDIPARFIAGVDARLIVGPMLLAAEGLVEYADTDGFERRNDGYYLTAGIDLNDANRLLTRLDVFEGTDQLVLGYNATATRAASFQTNLVVPLDDAPGVTRLVVNVQLAF